MTAARAITDRHGAHSASACRSAEWRTDQVVRRELDRRAWGDLLGAAIKSADASVRSVARVLDVGETTLRRWITGEVSAPLDLLDRLPPTVAERFWLLATVRVRARSAQRVTPADMMRALDMSIASFIRVRAEGQDPRAVLIKISELAATAAGGLDER